MTTTKTAKRKAGFTLLELVIAAAVLTVAVLSIAFNVLNLSDMSELSREKLVATADAARVLETMRETANSSLATLKTTDWSAWAAANVINAKASNELQLRQETIAATFPNPNTNPIQVVLTLSWLHKQRPYSYEIITLMTDRS